MIPFLLIFAELAHDCIGNTFITVDNNKQLKVYASLDIKVGEIIYNNYTASLYVSFDAINVCVCMCVANNSNRSIVVGAF